MLKVLKMPSLFALATKSFSTTYTYQASHFNRHPELKLVGENMLYSCPVALSVYDTPSLFIRFFVTDPLPPIQTSAGIYGLVASSPTKANKRMVIRVLEAKRGPESTL